MPSALAIECRLKVIEFLNKWVENNLLTYKFSVHDDPQQRRRVHVIFSKPTKEMPAPLAVAHFYFHLDELLQHVIGYTVESETHFHSLREIRFDERIIDQLIRRKLVLKQQHLIKLNDEFSSTRIPEMMIEREEEERDHERQNFEEYLLEFFQAKDPLQEGRIPFQSFRDVIYTLEMGDVGQHEREILFAFANLDHNEKIEYSSIVASMCDVIDTLIYTSKHLGQDKETQEKSTDEAIEWYHSIHKKQHVYTMNLLDQVINRLRPVTPIDADDTDKMDPHVEHFVTRRKLQSCLETPQLMLSNAERNLMLALVQVTSSGQIACSQLRSLYHQVKTMIFQFQSQCFHDRIDHYILSQFQSYERCKLKGSAKYLTMKLSQREINHVVRGMEKLLLTPFQYSRVIALCQHDPFVHDQIRSYRTLVSLITTHLQQQVDVIHLEERLLALHDIQQGMEEENNIRTEENITQIATEIFAHQDSTSLGALSLLDFIACLTSIYQNLSLPPLEKTEVCEICAIADPTGNGRVNYVHFQQLIEPLVRFMMHEKRIQQAITSRETMTRTQADAESKWKEGEDVYEEK